jgi:hypothetical protein
MKDQGRNSDIWGARTAQASIQHPRRDSVPSDLAALVLRSNQMIHLIFERSRSELAR